MRAAGRSSWILLIVVLAAILTTGVAIALVGAAQAPTRRQEFWGDVAGAGVQLATVTVIGVLVTGVLRFIDEARRRDEQRLQVFRDILLAYNQVKAVRRNLRTLGLRPPSEPLSATQALGLRQQMMTLNQAQLSLEAIMREQALSRLFKRAAALTRLLRTAEQWLGGVHARWEIHGGKIREGSDPLDLTGLDCPG